MSIDLVVQAGVVKSPALRYDANSRPELRFTLLQTEYATDGKSWPLFIPCCAVSATAERLASELEEDMAIVITSGKLCYRKRQTKLGEQSRLEILVWGIERLSTVGAVKSSAPGEYAGDHDTGALLPEAPGPAKKGKPRYPKWKPGQQN